MTAKKKKKSIFQSRFYQVYFIVVAVVLVAIAIGTAWLRNVLADYESAQPVHAAEQVARLFETGDYQRLYDLDTSAQQIAGGEKAFYLQSMEEITAGKTVEWSEAFSSDKDTHKYNVTLDGDRFASFTLVPSGRTTAKGNKLWMLGEVTTYVTRQEPDPVEEPEPTVAAPTPTPEPQQLYECRITVPGGYSVAVDGVSLSEENAQVTHGYLFEEGFLPEDVENPAMVSYVYHSTNSNPFVDVSDETGAAVAPKSDPDRERTWSCGLKEDETLKERYSERAYQLGQRIAKYISKDAKRSSIVALCLKDSPARTIFENLSNEYFTPHNSSSFSNPEVSEFYLLSENCFTCRVSFDYVLKTNAGKKVYPTAYTFCVVNRDGKGGLYNLQIY